MLHRDSNKEKIISLATERFLREGFARISVDEISTDLVMSKKTFYKIFSSKEDLINQIMDRMMAEARGRLAHIVDSNKNFIEKLNDLMTFLGHQASRFSKAFQQDVQRHAPDIWNRMQEFRRQRIMSHFAHLLEQGVNDQTVVALNAMVNPAVLPFIEMRGGLKSVIVSSIGDQISKQLKTGQPIEVYSQTRSIVGSVRHLYEVGSNTAATLILLFSIIVPLTKALLVTWAVLIGNKNLQRRTLLFVEMIAKWSMADVFAVAVMIAYLAAQASQTTPGSPNSALISFDASFGIGFYFFAAYCVTSLTVQQLTARYLINVMEVPRSA